MTLSGTNPYSDSIRLGCNFWANISGGYLHGPSVAPIGQILQAWIMDARVGSMHWSDGHRQNARHCRQADEEDAERVHTGVHHVLGENFSESDARSYRRKARQTVGAPGLSIGTGWAGAEPPPVENRYSPTTKRSYAVSYIYDSWMFGYFASPPPRRFATTLIIIIIIIIITGSAVALHCVKAHRQSQWRSPNFNPL